MDLFSCFSRSRGKAKYPKDMEKMRKREYPCLAKTTYLDHAGTTLPPRRMMKRFYADLAHSLYGNPHSNSNSSRLSSKMIEDVRHRALSFFKADSEHFDLVFTANSTGAIKLVMECFRDACLESKGSPGFHYLYHRDAHTSLVGVRQHAVYGSSCLGSDEAVSKWLSGRYVPDEIDCSSVGLFAYPAQSNMNGRRLPLYWPKLIRESQLAAHRHTYSLLDAAAFASTAQVDLSNAEDAPDFVTVSFYKIFGFPDIGALIVRKDSAHILGQRKYFGGGTVDMVTAIGADWHATKQTSIHEVLEDGTLPFHSIIALGHAITAHHEIYGSMSQISNHLATLSAFLYDSLRHLRHYNGRLVCMIYKDASSNYGDSRTQGPTVAFNVCNSRGLWVGKSEVEQLALQRGIELRTGGLCNPGGIATALDLSSETMKRNFDEGLKCGNDLDTIWGSPTGVVRVSLGAMSTRKEVTTFIKFVEETFLEREPGPMLDEILEACIHTVGSTTKTCPVETCRQFQLRSNSLTGGKSVSVRVLVD